MQITRIFGADDDVIPERHTPELLYSVWTARVTEGEVWKMMKGEQNFLVFLPAHFLSSDGKVFFREEVIFNGKGTIFEVSALLFPTRT